MDFFLLSCLSLTMIFCINGYGKLFNKILNIGQITFSETGFLGFFFLTFLSVFLHLFISLNENLNFILLIAGFFYFTISSYQSLNFLKKNYIFLTIALGLTLSMYITYKPHEDFGYYHLPYIVNLVSDKIIFGLSNLQPQFAWNSVWLNFSSLFYLPKIDFKGVMLVNGILYFYVILFFYEKLKSIYYSGDLFLNSNLYLMVLSLYIIIKFTRLSSFGFDFPSNIFALISVYFFFSFYEKKNTEISSLLLIFSIFSFLIKQNNFFVPLLFFGASYVLLKDKKIYVINLKLLYFTFFFVICWFLQQFIYSSCFFPALKFTCIKTIWYSDNISEIINSVTGSINKSFSSYKGHLSEKEYVNNFNWVSTWFYRNANELFEHFIAMTLFSILFLIQSFIKQKEYSLKDFNYKIKFKTFHHEIFLYIFLTLGFLLWFMKSPVIRFGIPYIFLINFLIYRSIFRCLIVKNDINIKFLIIFTFSFCLLFNCTKNIIRIYKEYHDLWPIFPKITYNSIKFNEVKINVPYSNSRVDDKLFLCWDVPFVCSISGVNNIIFEKKNNYLFILKKN